MKKILTLMAAVAAVFAFTPVKAEAGGYQSRVLSRCGSCGGNIYAYYRPVSYCNSRPVYGWVPSYHSNCGRSHSSRGHGGYRSHGSSYGSRSGVSIHFGFRSSPSYSNRGYSSGYGYRSSRSYGNRGYGYSSCR